MTFVMPHDDGGGGKKLAKKSVTSFMDGPKRVIQYEKADTIVLNLSFIVMCDKQGHPFGRPQISMATNTTNA